MASAAGACLPAAVAANVVTLAAKDARLALEIVRDLLGAYGVSMADVAFVRTFVTDLDRLAEIRAVRRRWFPGTPPASTLVEVSRLLHPDAPGQWAVRCSADADKVTGRTCGRV